MCKALKNTNVYAGVGIGIDFATEYSDRCGANLSSVYLCRPMYISGRNIIIGLLFLLVTFTPFASGQTFDATPCSFSPRSPATRLVDAVAFAGATRTQTFRFPSAPVNQPSLLGVSGTIRVVTPATPGI